MYFFSKSHSAAMHFFFFLRLQIHGAMHFYVNQKNGDEKKNDKKKLLVFMTSQRCAFISVEINNMLGMYRHQYNSISSNTND